MTQARRLRPRLRLTRDGILFVAGMLGIAHETLRASLERPYLLALFGGMVGLPAVLRRDEEAKK